MSERSFTANLDDDMLKALDDVLHCRICKGYYSGCVIAACGHNYCGHCIRKRMMNNQDCPFCFEDIREADLRNNKLVDKMVRIYDKLKLRNRLEEIQERPNETLRQYKIEIDDTLGPVSNNYEDIAMDDVSSDSQMNNLSLNNDTSTSFNNTSTNFNNTSTSFNNTSTSFNNTSTSFNNTSTSFNNTSTSFNNTSASFNSNNDTYSANITENYSNISTDINTSNNPCNSTEIQASNGLLKHILKKTQANEERINTAIQLLHRLQKFSSEVPHKADIRQLQTLEELEYFNLKLADTDEFRDCVRSFGLVGGRNEVEAIRRLLSKLISHKLSLQLIWSGSKTKHSFRDFPNIIQLIGASVRQNPTFKATSMATVELSIKRWLRNATDREGGRIRRKEIEKERAEKKEMRRKEKK